MFRRVGLSAMAGAALAVTLLAFGAPASASAETRAPDAVLKNVATGFCLDSNANKQVYTLGCNGGSYQKWTVTNGTTLKDLATGFCLDSNANKQVYTHDCNGGSYQKWTLGRGSHGTTLKNLATGFCLDSNANRQVYTHDCNGGSYQEWIGI
jgi:hypothetical protein